MYILFHYKNYRNQNVFILLHYIVVNHKPKLNFSGFVEEFKGMNDGKNAKRKYLNAEGFDQFDSFRPSEQEYYSYSELPRHHR